MSRRGFGRYVPVAERRAKAERKQEKLRASGRDVKPVRIAGRALAKSFWGKAWCENLEAYSDYSNRLPRGRTYARNGSILDLQIARGRIDALVNGSQLYTVALRIAPVEAEHWSRVRGECAGQISSLVELLQGEFSTGVMGVVTRPGSGLFPSPREIELSCSCPDWATMCKHVAATLYGVGARLDDEPEMLFVLRGVDPGEMLEEAIDRGVTERRRGRVLEVDDLSSVFGVDIDFSEDALEMPRTVPSKKPSKVPSKKPTKKPSKVSSKKPSKVPSKKSSTVSSKKPTKKPSKVSSKKPSKVSTAATSSNIDVVLAAIEAEPGLRTPELAEQLGLPRSAVVRAIARLKEWGLVVFVGPRQSGGYRPVE